MSKVKHTPTPWKVADDGTLGSVWTADGNTQVAQTQEVSVRDRLQGSVIRKANAEFIVRACNAYDDLLAACKGALEADPYGGDGDLWQPQIRAAIAKAEGRV